ncbi:MAG: gliding motility-associated C-terminal domain-containing protein [Bacteroidales bacterium]
MRYCLYLLFFLILPYKLFAQLETVNWWFGHNAGISFLSNPPITFLNNGFSIQGVACISDSIGNFLFYSNGELVLNRNGDTMQNGVALFGSCASEGVLIVPFPDNNQKFYLFTLDKCDSPSNPYPIGYKGFNYNVVDIGLNAGLGAVTLKNIHLADSTGEKLTAVRHCNGRDVWVIIYKQTTDKYLSYLVTPSGIQTNPIISNGSFTSNFYGYSGDIKISPNGKKIASVLFGLEALGYHVALFDFNNETGVLSNPIQIQNPWSMLYPYGCEFSPDNKKLYVSYPQFFGGSNTSAIFQYDISSNNQALINLSATELYLSNGHNWEPTPCSIQMGIDYKLYISIKWSSKLWKVHNPNQVGLGCNLDTNGIVLLSGSSSDDGLPNFISSYFAMPSDINYTHECLRFNFMPVCDSVSLDSLQWAFGNTGSGIINTSTSYAPSHIFSDTGIYTVKVKYFYHCRTDSVSKQIAVYLPSYNFPPSWINDTLTPICKQLQFVPHCDSASLDSLLWNFGDAGSVSNMSTSFNPVHTFSDTGNFQVRLLLYAYCRIDTIYKNVLVSFPVQQYSLGNDTVLCNNDSLLLSPTIISAIPYSYNWQDGDTSAYYRVKQAGTYICTLNAGGCLFIDSIHIGYKNTPQLSLFADTVICEDSGVEINIPPGDYACVWNDGNASLFRRLNTTANFSVTLSNLCGSVTSNFKVQIKNCHCYLYLPNAFSPDGNSLNDCFKSIYECEFEAFHLYIYNRWGQLIYDTEDPQQCWDGSYKNQKAQSEVYIWLVEYIDKQTHIKQFKKGIVSLLE